MITIATASTAEYFHFVQGMILSVREKPQSEDLHISLYDLGLTAEQLAWMKDYVDNIVKPEWEFGLSAKDGFREPFKAILAKPLLRKYFPGYDIYLHLDADAWVQDWFAIDLYLAGAQKGALAITPEIDRAYSANYSASGEFHTFIVELYARTWGEEYVKKYAYYPILNAGVFAMPKDSPVWGLWEENIRVSLTNYPYVEQTALNLAVFEHSDQFHYDEPDKKNIQLLPATCNWLCHQCLPLLDKEHDVFVEPYLPHAKLGIIHRASDTFRDKKSARIYTTDGESIVCNLKYKEGMYDSIVESAEPEKLSDWQERGGKKF
jgi:hypothetical protein